MANDLVSQNNVPSTQPAETTDFSLLGRMCVESGKKRYDRLNKSTNKFDKNLDFFSYYKDENDDNTVMSCVIGLAQDEDTRSSSVHIAFGFIRDNYEHIKEVIMQAFHQLSQDHLEDEKKYLAQRISARKNSSSYVEIFPEDDDEQ